MEHGRTDSGPRAAPFGKKRAPRQRVEKPKSPKQVELPTAAPAAAAPPPPPPPPAAPEPGMEQHRFRLGEGRYTTMTHPEDMTVAEWRRWAVNTLTRCVDYDPTNSPPIISTGIVRSSS